MNPLFEFNSEMIKSNLALFEGLNETVPKEERDKVISTLLDPHGDAAKLIALATSITYNLLAAYHSSPTKKEGPHGR